MRDCVRHQDIVTRLGGDEFVILSPRLSRVDDADFIARKLLAAVTEPLIAAEGGEISCTASIGIAVYPHDARDAEARLHHADVAMYRAKERGRNRFERFAAGDAGQVQAPAHANDLLALQAADQTHTPLYPGTVGRNVVILGKGSA